MSGALFGQGGSFICSAGQPAVVSVFIQDRDGKLRSLNGRRFLWRILDRQAQTVRAVAATGVGTKVVFALSGADTAALALPDLNHEIAELVEGGRTPWLRGTFKVTIGALDYVEGTDPGGSASVTIDYRGALVIQALGAPGYSASDEAGMTPEEYDASIRLPALEAAAQAGADVDGLILATGQAFSEEKAALDDHVAAKDVEVDASVAEAYASADTATAQGEYALAQGLYAKSQADSIGDVSDAVAETAAAQATVEGIRDDLVPTVALVEGFDARLVPVEGVSLPAPGILAGRSVDLVAYDRDDRPSRAVAGTVDLFPDGYGQWAISAVVTGPTMPILDRPTTRGDDAVSVDADGRMIPAPSDIVIGPAAPIVRGVAPEAVRVDAEGRALGAQGGGVPLTIDAFGWTVSGQVSGPSVGMLDRATTRGDDAVSVDADGRMIPSPSVVVIGPAAPIVRGVAPEAVRVDAEGRALGAQGAGVPLTVDAYGWTVMGQVSGPAAGILDRPMTRGDDAISIDANGRMIPTPSDVVTGPAPPLLGDTSPDLVSIDAAGRTVTARIEGVMRAPDGFGGWLRGDRYEGPAPGIISPGRQEGAVIVVVDSAGRRMRARLDGNVEVVSTPAGDVVLDGAIKAVIPPPTAIEPGPITFTTPTIAVPAATIERGGGVDIVIPAGTVTSPLPSIATITGEAVAAGVGQQTFLSSESLIAITAVRRASDGAPLTVGTDCTFEAARGVVTNLTTSALVIDYTTYRQRQDAVSAHPTTGALTITLGQERPRAANIWRGLVPAGNIEVGHVFNSGNQIIYSPTWRYRAGHHVARRADDASTLALCRQAVARTRGRLLSGLATRLLIYGDSRMEMGGNGPAEGGRNSYPNSDASKGFSRDVGGYFALYDVATRTRAGILPAIDFGDGHGAIHAREGFAWRMARRLEAAYGITFDAGPNPVGPSYRNWAIGGTDSGTTLMAGDPVGNQRANGLHPTRWAALKADIIPGQTLLVLGFGMNELASTATYGNLIRMATEAKALGAEVMMIATTRPDLRWSANVAGWRFTCRETVRAAIDTGSAWVDPSEILSPENLVGLGLSEPQICDTTGQNHEGVGVQDPIGLRAAEILI